MVDAICSNKGYDQMRADYRKMKDILTTYKMVGGVLPPPMAKAFWALDQAYVAGDNFDAAFKSACSEMGSFLSSSEEYCARHVGFDNMADQISNGGVRWQERDNFDICMAQNYYKTVQAEAVKKILNISDPKSFASVFTDGVRRQLWSLVSSWLGEKFKASLKKQ